MLVRQDGTTFTTARARYLDRAPASPEQTQKIIVKITGEPLGGVIFAELDTGAAWSVLDAEVAAELSLLGGSGTPVRISTRHGAFDGRLERTTLELLADEGESLTIEATVWVSPAWQWGNFLGYAGLLERIRFAVDPSDNSFYFGTL
jgi:hypothetical protein